MSLELHNVSKMINAGGVRHPLFENLNLRIETGDRVGILGMPKSGKSTLLRMICGTEPLFEGKIERTSRVSWPIPLSEIFASFATVATNIRFVGRIYGHVSDEFVKDIGKKGDIAEFLNTKLGDCPRHVKSQLAFALGIGMDFDLYLFDDRVVSGSKEYQEKALALVKELDPNRGLLVATSNPKEITAHCNAVFILHEAHVTHYADVKQGIKYFKSLKRDENQEFDDPRKDVEVAEEDMGIGIGL